ncbi:MAG: hypothetical protein QOJ13_396 [Gaiellales bacterium]|nr:hypothetical protein [Gaiellales bacterium]
MTDDERHDEVTRLLREQGSAPAPPGLRDEVMRRVRQEPRAAARPVRRSVLTLVAASLVTIALVGGISRLGGSGVSGSDAAGTSASGAAAKEAFDSAGGTSAPLTTMAGPLTVKNVPEDALTALLNGLTERSYLRDQSTNGSIIDLYVADSQWAEVRQGVQRLVAKAAPDAHRVEVRLYRLPE